MSTEGEEIAGEPFRRKKDGALVRPFRLKVPGQRPKFVRFEVIEPGTIKPKPEPAPAASATPKVDPPASAKWSSAKQLTVGLSVGLGVAALALVGYIASRKAA